MPRKVGLEAQGVWHQVRTCEKIELYPLTLLSPVTPRREEGKHFEIKKKFPPPRWGRVKVGVIQKILSQLLTGRGSEKWKIFFGDRHRADLISRLGGLAKDQ